MTSGDNFIIHLMGLGLTEKKCQCYPDLLKYGLKTFSSLAKPPKTHCKGIHRTLNTLFERGIVRASLNSPMAYSAVELETALEAAPKKDYRNVPD